ncbi:MAG TPA: FecR family protein, partial [Polyangiaceae bacterium]
MTEACERWMAISDREALDEPLSDAERAFLVRHETTCAACGIEASLYRDLAAESTERSVAVPGERVDRVLGALYVPARPESAEVQRAPASKPRAKDPFWARLGPGTRRALAGVAAAAALASLLSFLDQTKRDAPAPVAVARVVLTLSSGTAEGTAPTLGELTAGSVVTTSTGPACLHVDPGVTACVGENSELRVADVTLAHRRLELTRGRVVVSLQKQPAGTSLSVATANGRVTAVGTVFSVEISGSTTIVRVEEGTVVAEQNAAASRYVHRDERVVLGENAVAQLASAEAERDRTLVEKGSLFVGGEAATLDVPRSGAGAWVKLDGVSLGPAPLSVLVAPGPHRFETGNAERVLSSGPIVVSPGRSVIGTITATADRAPPAPVAEPAPVKAQSANAPEHPGVTAPPPAVVPKAPDAQGSSAAFPEQPPETRSAPELLRTARS